MATTKSKDLGLEGLRGLASLAVAIGHCTFVFSPYLANLYRPIPGLQPRYPIERLLQWPPFSLIFSADAAVSIFFVMSGYVLTSKYFATGDIEALQSGAAKRYVRLVLPCLAAVMFAWVLARTGAIITHEAVQIGAAGWVPAWYAKPGSFLGAIFNGLIGTPLFGHTELDPPLWSIQVELIGSILLFAMFSSLGRQPVWLCVWFVFFSILFGYATPNMLYYVEFFIGAWLNQARGWLRSRQLVSAGLFVIGLFGVAYSLHPFFSVMQKVPLPKVLPYIADFNTNRLLFWNSIGAVLLVAGVLGCSRIHAVFATRPLVFLGKISFAVYIVHIPILMSVGLRTAKIAQAAVGLSYGQSVFVAMFVFLAVVIAFATLFQKVVDAPSIRLANWIANLQIGGRKPEVVAVRSAVGGT